MKKAPHRSRSSDMRALAGLGEQLTSTTSLAVQRDRIISMTQRMVAGQVDLWIAPDLFRLPDRSDERLLFPGEPELKDMRKVYYSGNPVLRVKASKSRKSETLVAFPLEDQGIRLGVLQIKRKDGSEFQPEEIELLEGLTSIVSVGLFAAHRMAVEKFRQDQINLVWEVSAQVANVMDVDVLSQRVTDLIQKTFHYYYVGIFTLEPSLQKLRFRSSASNKKKGRSKTKDLFEVEIGQGLIGEAAQVGERVLVENVQADERYRFIANLPETRSEVVLPLKIGDRVLGVLDVQSDQLQAFHPNDLLILDTLAVNIARAVEGANLYGDLRRRADHLALIAEVSDTVTSSLDIR
jgi:sigma-B regulation protein RsbU (phosphoserine phosphatase)